jgi:hypothetical protein
MQHFDVVINKHQIEVIIDARRNHWYVLFPKYGQYASGEINSHFERIHHALAIGTRAYSLVIDPNDDLTAWESFSFFDEKKQAYIDTAQGKLQIEKA